MKDISMLKDKIIPEKNKNGTDYTLNKNSEDFCKNTADSFNGVHSREICRCGSFESAFMELRALGLLEKEIALTEKIFKDEINKLYPLSKKDLEMLTIIRLFDNKTFIHSIETFVFANKKIERPLEGGITFSELIKNDGLTIEQFQRSCLFHDIGKIVIPKFLLDSHYTDENWAQAFVQLSKRKAHSLIRKHRINIPKNLLDDPGALMEYMIRNRIRGARFVPIGTLFSKKQIKVLDKMGFSPEMSLIDIMQKHEKESEKILNFMGYATEAKIAGAHHNYKTANRPLPIVPAKASIQNDNIAADIIHLADIQEALRSNRPYLSQRPLLKTLAFMVDDAKRGLVSPLVTYLWIKDDLQKIDRDYLNLVMHGDENDLDLEHLRDRKKELDIITTFLQKVEQNLPRLINLDS